MIESIAVSRREIADILKVIDANPTLTTSTKARYKKVVANYLVVGAFIPTLSTASTD